MEPGHPSALSADLAHLGLQVTPDNIVQVSAVLHTEADRLEAQVNNTYRSAVVGRPGDDPVSRSADGPFNKKIKALLDGCQAYYTALRSAGDELKASASAYGHTEDDASRVLKEVERDYGQQNAILRSDPTSPSAAILWPYIAPSVSRSFDSATEWTPLIQQPRSPQ